MLKYFADNNVKDCCGCRACEQICAYDAITFSENDEGFLYPVLKINNCINCGICEKVCPLVNHGKIVYQEGRPYAAQFLLLDELHRSSSGGGFIGIASYIINQGGVVYGAAYNESFIVMHRRVDSKCDLKYLVGSKYVQSDINDIFNKVKRDLKNGRLVYFTGTPCQVAGLRLYLIKDYDSLITSDLICHGVPSPKIFAKVVSVLEKKYKGALINYNFRDKKKHGWSCSSSSTYKNINNKTRYVNYAKDMEAYFNAFISGDLMRMSCYDCPFATTQRCGDITLADFWGVRKIYPNFPNINKGVSLIICNTNRGSNVWDNIKENYYYFPIDMEEAKAYNHNLNKATVITDSRKEAYRLIMSNYNGFVSKYYKKIYIVEKMKIEIESFIRSHHSLFNVVSKILKLVK